MLISMNVEKWVTGVVPKTDLHLMENVIKMLIVITLQALSGRGIGNRNKWSIIISDHLSIRYNQGVNQAKIENLRKPSLDPLLHRELHFL